MRPLGLTGWAHFLMSEPRELPDAEVERHILNALCSWGPKLSLEQLRARLWRQVSGQQVNEVVGRMVREGRLRSAGRAGVYAPGAKPTWGKAG